MPFHDVIELPAARIEIEERAGYLLIIESGTLRTIDEVTSYTRQLSRAAARSGCKQAIIDARGELGEPSEAVRNAMWSWLESDASGFEAIAFVLPSEIAATRVNMTAISRGSAVRAFESVTPARRWLARGPRASTADTMHAIRAASSAPPTRRPPVRSDIMEPPKVGDTERPSAYHSSEGRVERVGDGHPKSGPPSDERAKSRGGNKGGSQVA